tara:strand:+ start:1245 stop:1583 length:339 start_codon:yes stop_codon:yes gene_type:complete
MLKIKLIVSICIFSILLGITSAIKNQTRIIEKKINKINQKLLVLGKDLNETELDYFYLSSPKHLSQKVNNLALIEYIPMDFSRIYLNLKDFNDSQKKITILKKSYEKKIQKK